MAIIHILNVADVFFMAAGVGAAVLMMIVGGYGDERTRDRKADGASPSAPRARR